MKWCFDQCNELKRYSVLCTEMLQGEWNDVLISVMNWSDTVYYVQRCYKESALGLHTVGPHLAALLLYSIALLSPLNSVIVSTPLTPIRYSYQYCHYLWRILLEDYWFVSQGRQCDDSLIEEVFALMKLRFIIFLHITNRAVYIESTRLYMSGKRRRERKPREKRKESMHSINDSDERAHTLRRYLNDRYANERNVDIQCYVFNNDRQAMYHHYQRHLHYNCYK